MTDEEALEILKTSDSDISGFWPSWGRIPQKVHANRIWNTHKLCKLSGYFSSEELQALLHFAPKDK